MGYVVPPPNRQMIISFGKCGGRYVIKLQKKLSEDMVKYITPIKLEEVTKRVVNNAISELEI